MRSVRKQASGRRNMPTAERRSTVFGDVLAEFMEARGLEATPEEVVRLGYCARLDGKELLRDVQQGIPGRRGRQKLTGLADELDLTEPQKARLALAYTFEEYRR
jgi:hypothetical protein